MNKATVYAKENSVRIAPKKVAPVMNLVRNKPLLEAKLILAFDTTKAAKMILKALNSAEANAKNNLNLNPAKLFVTDLQVNGGRVLKRGRAAARGRSAPILKRTSHFIVGLSEKDSQKGENK